MNRRGPFVPPGAYHPPPVPELEAAVVLAKPGPPLTARHAPVVPSEPYESDVQHLLLADIPVVSLAGPLFITSRRWRGIDVYVDTSFGPDGPQFVTVQLFANMRGFRVLVASGRTRSTLVAGPIRICSSRVLADSFEVVVSQTAIPADPTLSITIGYVATDQAEDMDPVDVFEGAITPNPSGALDTFVGGLSSLSLPVAKLTTLVAIAGVNTLAVNRFLLVFYRTVAPVAGNLPNLSYLIPPFGSIFVDNPILRKRSVFASDWTVIPSTTGASLTFAGAADVAQQVWFE